MNGPRTQGEPTPSPCPVTHPASQQARTTGEVARNSGESKTIDLGGEPVNVETPRPPVGVRAAGRRLWLSVTDVYVLEEHELAVLREAVRTVDYLDALDRRVRVDGPIVSSPQGDRAHPAAVEARQQRIALARLLAALRLPAGEVEQRPQRRVGVRGTYGITGAVS